MRRGSMMVLALLAATTALTALPGRVSAQPSLPGLLGAITRPLGNILRGPRVGRRSQSSRRTARSQAPAATQSGPAAASPAAPAAAGAAAVAGAAAATAGSPAEAKPTAVGSQPEKTATPTPPQAVMATAPAAAPETPPDKTVTAKPTPALKDSAPKDSAPAAAQTTPSPSPVSPSPAATSLAATSPAATTGPAATAGGQDSLAAVNTPTPLPPPASPAPAAVAVPAVAAVPAATPVPPAAAPVATVAPPPAAPAPAATATVATTPPDVAAPPAVQAPTAAVPAPVPPVAARAPSQRNAALARPEQSQSQNPDASANQPPRGQNRLGFAGPLAWPTAFEDVIGFSLWPGEYSDRLRGHGIGDVMSAVLVPASKLMAELRPALAMARTDTKADASLGSGGICNIDPASEQWPAAQIERTVQLNSVQREALAELKIAFRDAAASIKAACRNEATVPPVERLRAMQGTLWATHDALIGLRRPLAKFFDWLSEEQRKRFAAPASAQADPRSMTPAAIASLCGAPPATEGQARQAERQLNLNKAQRASLDAFQKKAAEMGQFLMASCLRPVASTPVERIDAAADRLTAVIFAASSVNLALNDFYNQLDDAQKTKFNNAIR